MVMKGHEYVIKILNIKMAAFWDMARCNIVEVHRRFRGTYYFDNHCPDDEVLTSETLVYFYYYTVLSQKAVIFILAALRT
jgi:hypothetical protein